MVTSADSNGSAGPPAYQAHPIGPLSSQEIEGASALIRRAWPDGTYFQFKVITLLEPAKAELVPYLDAERKGQQHHSIDRRAFVVYYLKNTVRIFSISFVSPLMAGANWRSTNYTRPS